MKLFTIVCVATLGYLASAYSLPSGEWKGMGHYTNKSGAKGDYSETLTVKDNVMTNEITAGDKKAVYKMTFEFDDNSFAKVQIRDEVKKETREGKGYCGSVWCHVEETGKFEMTVVFIDKKVFELGSDNDEHGWSWFESELDKQ